MRGAGSIEAILRFLATATLLVALVLGILAIPAGALYGIDSPLAGAPLPMDELLRRRFVAKAVMFSGGGVALAAAISLYAIGRPRPR